MMGYGSGLGIFWNLLFNIILILLIVGVVMLFLNRSGYGRAGAGPGSEERLARMEKDLEETKKMVEDIKKKLEEI
ncbi:MAG: hypothetical protein PHV51_08310 [Methanosarcinaceae archaeon]|nr:hypothetical protein [Methanosarcinaceae archaeon]MDD4498133.1 hypothetical protein [Methanosarcinaceae archaeon]